jgi:hypothetical protein
VFIGLGLFILIESGVIVRLFEALMTRTRIPTLSRHRRRESVRREDAGGSLPGRF